MLYATEGRRLETVRAIRALVKVEPAAAGDKGLVELVAGAVDDPDASYEAIAALEESLGTLGVDALIEIAARKGPSRARVQQSLTKSSVREHASPAALVVLDLRAATSCEAKRDVLPRAEQDGDARALKLLKPMAARSGCGFLGLIDCFPCLRSDKALADAIAAIEARRHDGQ
jgi:serine/threonine-protein kinase